MHLPDRQSRQRLHLGKAMGKTDVLHQIWAEQST